MHGEGEQRLFRALLQRHHYLGLPRTGRGESAVPGLRPPGRALSCVLFGAAAWTMACRDRFIGWERAERERGLARLANNMRFLIVPWARVPHLASHVLGRIARRISRDWQAKYGHRVVLLETYVEQHRFNRYLLPGGQLAVRRPRPEAAAETTGANAFACP